MWTSSNEEGWLLPSDAESWQCAQTLEIVSSVEPNVEEAFFNQVVALPRAGLFLLANAKKNAIYAVHIEYGPHPGTTRMDYIAEFTVTMPILSLTGTSDSLPDGEHIVQIYCVQTQAIQQYALDLSQCLPPPIENVELEKTNPAASHPFDAAHSSSVPEPSYKIKPSEMSVGNVTSLTINSESTPSASHLVKMASSEVTSLPVVSTSGVDCEATAVPYQIVGVKAHSSSTPLPLSPRLSRNLSGFRNLQISNETSPPLGDHAGDQDIVKDNIADASPSGDNLRKGDNDVMQTDISMVSSAAVAFRHPTHLVTPSEILSTAASSSEHSQINQGTTSLEARVEDVNKNDAENIEVEVKVIGETGAIKNDEDDIYRESHEVLADKKNAFYSQASDLGFQMARDCINTYSVEGIVKGNDAGNIAALEQPSNTTGREEVQDTIKDVASKAGESETRVISPVQATKGKKQKGKNSQVSGHSSSSPSPFNSADSSNEPDGPSGAPHAEAALPQLSAMKDMLDQVIFFFKPIFLKMKMKG